MSKNQKAKQATGQVESPIGVERKPYRAPRLEKFGNIADITGGKNGSRNDPGQRNQTKKGNG